MSMDLNSNGALTSNGHIARRPDSLEIPDTPMCVSYKCPVHPLYVTSTCTVCVSYMYRMCPAHDTGSSLIISSPVVNKLTIIRTPVKLEDVALIRSCALCE